MTGGMNAAGGFATAQRMAVDYMKNAGVSQSAFRTLFTNWFKDPAYWMSAAQELGSDYENVCQYTDDPFTQGILTMFTTLVNAGIEIGPSGQSGIQGIGQEGEKGIFG